MKLKIIQQTGKRLAHVLLAALILLLLLAGAACTSSDSVSEDALSDSGSQDGLVIVASIFAPYDFSRTLAGDVADVSMLVPPGAESHSFEPTPANITLLNSADVFIYVGGESDAWLDKILASLDNPDLTLVRLVDLVPTLEEEELEGAESPEGDAEEGHEHEIDEHVWTSLRNSEMIVTALAATFSELDTEHAEVFEVNAEALNEELNALDTRIAKIVAGAERTTLVVGDRFPFRYFVEDYGLDYYAAFPGCSTAVDTNPATIAFLIDTVKQQDIPVVFYIELSDQRIANSIAGETGAQTLLLHSAHNISKEDFEAGVTYVDLMRANADNLEAALT